MTNTCAKTIPGWLAKLSPGEYQIKEVMKITKQKYENIYARFVALEVDRFVGLYEPKAGVYVYEWKGAIYYVKKFSKQKGKQ